MVSHEQYGNTGSIIQDNNISNRISQPPAQSAQLPASTLNLPPINEGLSLQERPAEAMRLAQEAFAQTSNWVEFFRESLGVDGFVRKLFTTVEEIQYFEESREHGQLQEMLTALRSQDLGKGDTTEPQRMITVRLPKSLHEYLRVQAEEHNLSINKLCISKLLQTVDEKMVPEERGGRRGRRPGPQGPRKKKEESQPEATYSSGSLPQQPQGYPQQYTQQSYQSNPQRPHFG